MLYKRPRPRRLVVERHRWLRGADLSSVTRRIPGENRADPMSCCAGPRTGRCSASAARTSLSAARQEEPRLPASPSRCLMVFWTEASCPSHSSPSIVMTDGNGH